MDWNFYNSGTTVKLDCQFNDFVGNPIDPTNVKIIFYDDKYTKLQEIPLTEANRVDVGLYTYNFVTEAKTENTKVYYEWYGEVMGVPSLKRNVINTKFVV